MPENQFIVVYKFSQLPLVRLNVVYEQSVLFAGRLTGSARKIAFIWDFFNPVGWDPSLVGSHLSGLAWFACEHKVVSTIKY